MEFTQNGRQPNFASPENRTQSTDAPAALESRSTNTVESSHIPRNYMAPYTMDTAPGHEERYEPLAAMQPDQTMAFNGFSNSPVSPSFPNQLNYSPEDFNYVPQWNSDNIYGSMDDYPRPNAYGNGHNVQAAPHTYEELNTNGNSASYADHSTESSVQQNPWTSNFQPGQGISNADFDIPSFEMPPRTLTRTPAPISSADTFDGSTVPLSFETILSDPHFSPTCSATSSHSSYDTMWSTSRNATSNTENSANSNVPIQPSSSSPTQMLSTSQDSTDTTHLKPYRCTQRGCTRSYARKFELYRHQRRHTGVKSHHCQVPGCERGASNGFYRKDHLRQHMRQVHGS